MDVRQTEDFWREREPRHPHELAGALRDFARERVDAGETVLAGTLRVAAERLERVQDERDSGYANHETFLAAMQLEGNMTPGGAPELERTQRIVRLRLEAPAIDTADALREHVQASVEGEATELRYALASDLLGTALARVDWLELANTYRQQLVEERPELRPESWPS